MDLAGEVHHQVRQMTIQVRAALFVVVFILMEIWVFIILILALFWRYRNIFAAVIRTRTLAL